MLGWCQSGSVDVEGIYLYYVILQFQSRVAGKLLHNMPYQHSHHTGIIAVSWRQPLLMGSILNSLKFTLSASRID